MFTRPRSAPFRFLPIIRRCQFLVLSLLTTGAKAFGEFANPTADDVRGPCPGMNIMANYDIINRNGKGIPVDELVAAFEETFGLSSVSVAPFMEFLHQSGLKIDDRTEDGNGGTVDLNYFYATLTDNNLLNREEPVAGHNHPLYSEERFQALAAHCDEGVCTAQNMFERAVEGYHEECAKDDPFPSSRALPTYHAVRAGGIPELFLTRGVSDEELTLDSKINLDVIQMAVDENRLPDDFVTRTEAGIPPRITSEMPLFQHIYGELCTLAATLKEEGCETMPQCPPPQESADKEEVQKSADEDEIQELEDKSSAVSTCDMSMMIGVSVWMMIVFG